MIKKGAEGVLVATADGMTTVAPHRVEVVCGLGAGDAFGAALAHGLLAGWDPVDIAVHANAAGAIVASRLACADAMPTLEELDHLLSEEGTTLLVATDHPASVTTRATGGSAHPGTASRPTRGCR